MAEKKGKLKSPIGVILSFVSRKIPGAPVVDITKEVGQWMIKLGDRKTRFVTMTSEIGQILENEVKSIEEAEKVVGHIFGEEGVRILRNHLHEFTE